MIRKIFILFLLLFGVAYPNNLKNWNFGKAGAQSVGQQSDAEAAQLQQVGRCKQDRNLGCPAQPKTDSSGGCLGIEAKTHVLVSIAPQKYLVERIGEDLVAVDVIVPLGANSHTYEPTPKQVIALQKGDIWFRIGENFEPRLMATCKGMEILDQREGLDLIQAGCGCCIHNAHDPHIWLSPKLLKQQATQIAAALSQHDPQNASCFSANLMQLHTELEKLDETCTALLGSSSQKIILVSHPAFGYLCRDYGLRQLSIEMEGREPTPRYITELLTQVRSFDVKTLFLQKQHHPRGGIKIAEEIGASTQYIDPYAENVIENIKTIATLFSQA